LDLQLPLQAVPITVKVVSSNKKSHTAETVPKFNRKIVERRKSDTSSIHKNDRSLSGFGTSSDRMIFGFTATFASSSYHS
jgi:hypothetical protein